MEGLKRREKKTEKTRTERNLSSLRRGDGNRRGRYLQIARMVFRVIHAGLLVYRAKIIDATV